MLWLALHLPSLPLDIHGGAVCNSEALILSVHPAPTAVISHCNETATRLGIRPGMPLASAWSLCPAARLLSRQPEQERQALKLIAACALRYSPKISLDGEQGLLLEIGGSLRLFGTARRLTRQLVADITLAGHHADAAVAPTPLAAHWLARSRPGTCITDPQSLTDALATLPLHAVTESATWPEALARFGLRTIGDCLKMPRNALARRGGRALFASLDRALGSTADPRPLYAPPSQRAWSLPLPAATAQLEALLFVARRLCLALCGQLSLDSAGAQSLQLILHHERHPATVLRISLLSASRDPAHWLLLLRERLARTALTQAVSALTLGCPDTQALVHDSQVLFNGEPGQSAVADRLIEQLRARLGDDCVFRLQTHDDHRPERAWVKKFLNKNNGLEINPTAQSRPHRRRPLWLLTEPRRLSEKQSLPQYEGPLQLLTGPERIETGWWDGAPVARDYFIARSPAHALLWIYRERHSSGHWYLHGLFG